MSHTATMCFKTISRSRAITANGGQKPFDYSPVTQVRVDWDHYPKVLQAKHDQLKK